MTYTGPGSSASSSTPQEQPPEHDPQVTLNQAPSYSSGRGQVPPVHSHHESVNGHELPQSRRQGRIVSVHRPNRCAVAAHSASDAAARAAPVTAADPAGRLVHQIAGHGSQSPVGEAAEAAAAIVMISVAVTGSPEPGSVPVQVIR